MAIAGECLRSLMSGRGVCDDTGRKEGWFMHNRFKYAAAGALTALAVLSMAAAAQAEPTGTLRVAVGVDPESFDPQFNTFPTGNTVDILVLEGLYSIGPNDQVMKDLATDSSFSEDGMTFTVKIKTGHVFSNGNPLDASAVAASFNRLLDPKTGSVYRGLYSSIKEVVAVGDDTVEFHLAEPNGHIIMLLAASAATIVDVKAAEEMGSEYSRTPIGSGPYMIDSYVGGERYRLVPNPKYQGDHPATLAAIEFQVVPEDGSRMALLETGDVQIAERVPPESIDAVDALDGVTVLRPPSMFSINMEMVLKGPLEDQRVREALNLAVDREGIIKGILGGLATPSVTMPGPGTQEDLRVTFDPIPYDPEKAKALLAEAGYQPGQLKLTMTCPIGRYIKDSQVCQALAGLWQGIGIDAKADIMPRASWSDVLALKPAERKDNMAMVGRATAGMDYTLYRLFYTGVGANTTGYSNPKVDELLKQGRATTDMAKQKEIYAEVQKIIWDEKPFVFLWYQKQALGVADSVKGFQVRSDETMLLDDVSVAE